MKMTQRNLEQFSYLSFLTKKIRIFRKHSNYKRSNYNVFSNFFKKIFEKSSSYREEFSLGTEKKVRPIEMFKFSSVRVFEIFFASKGLVNSRDLKESSTYRVVRVFECSSYRESTVFVSSIPT